MKAVLLLCLTGVTAMKLLKDKEKIKPVQDESLMGLNLVNTQAAHKTLSQLKAASQKTALKPIIDAADQGLNMVEYHAKKEARVVSDTMKSAEDAMRGTVKYHMENDQKNFQKLAEKEKKAVDYEVHKLKDAVDYQVNHTLKPLDAHIKYEAQAIKGEVDKLSHTVQVLSHKQKVEEHMEKLKTYTYKDFVKEHQRTWEEGSTEWKSHEAAFNKKYAMIQAHNSGLPNNAWATGINKFMDYTEEELSKMFGYKGVKESATKSSLLQVDEDEEDLPAQFSWSPRLKTASFHRDQGACGSCWAVAAAQVVESHLALIYNETYKLSMQHLVSCTPNPEQCGGTGGCQGATSELAFKYIQDNGIAADAHWPYNSGFDGQDGQCNKNLVQNNRLVQIGSYVVLPENKQTPILKALYQQGPLVVSVAASNWQMYSFGVFAGCSPNAIINHAVVAEGYGSQISDLDHKEHKYFLIKNSWGNDWGEDGYMKVKRFDSEEEHCGIDNKPQDGTGCKNGPSEVRVCGMCGILYDSAYPLHPQFIGKEHGGVYLKGVAPQALKQKTKSLISNADLPLR